MINPVLIFALALIGNEAHTPVARWDFDTEETKPLAVTGKVQRDQAGPRSPEFPDMPANNTAVRLDGKAYLSVPDSSANSVFDFSNGDAITIEAWVHPTQMRGGQVSYVVGKGRTGSPEFARDNQNWSLRLTGAKDEARLSFLFATKLSSSEAHWHRWDSEAALAVGAGWHHIAVAYRFGDPNSIRGWINGQPTEGDWSYGGQTTEPPVVDNDEIRIGNGFEGMLDAIAIYRRLLSDELVATHARRVGQPQPVKLQAEVMPEFTDIPDGRVLFQLSPGLPTHSRWLNEGEQWPAESLRWTGDLFLLPRMPLNYDAWGIRNGWEAPLLLRMAAEVELPRGVQRFMVRSRALSRLWVDGKIVARTEAIAKRPPDGEEPITPIAEPPLAGVRVHGYHQQEAFGEALIELADSRKSRLVLEIVVGGSGHRSETGEVCVAMLTEDGKAYDILGANAQRLPLTDAAVEPALMRIEKSLAELDDQRRRSAAASEDDFWHRRHETARQWVREQSPLVFDEQLHPTDALIQAKIDVAVAESAAEDAGQAERFHGQILPILREHCFRCHGEKDQGGLKLDSREAALKAGDSEVHAVVPGDVAASELIARIRSGEMPPTEEGLSATQVEILEQWVADGAFWPAAPLAESDVALAPLTDDHAFLRRIYLDTIGIPPTEDEFRVFLADRDADKRTRLIQALIQDERMADGWMNFWLDLLAENPSLLNASLNSTGPFRWFLYDSLRDNKPLDRMVTELILQRGGAAEGGSAGFGVAAENDLPFAAKAHIVASAFLGIELQCARCHDSPYHSTTQQDLYALAAMFNRDAVTVPKTSRVPAAFFENQQVRKSLIQVTLEPNQPVSPEWPFAAVTGVADGSHIDHLMQQPADTRERLAALVTAPENVRFSRVIVNRIWKRLMGAGMVEPVHDWEGNVASHPQLLNWLAQELVAHDYDFRHVVQRIVSSQAYQRQGLGRNLEASAAMRLFNAPERRRLSAEQIVDSLHHAVGRPIDVEELTFVHDGRRELGHRQTLGVPTRAWMFGDLKNERDRPSLSLPEARAVVDVLEAFGWTGARQMPVVERETDSNILQPAILANGPLSVSLTRASHGSDMAALAIAAPSPASLVDSLFLRCLCRFPSADERIAYTSVLAPGFDARLVPTDKLKPIEKLPPLPLVTWFNHGQAEANEIQLENERRVLAGPPPDPRLSPDWRTAFEDVLWSLVNHREFVWMP